MKNFDVDSERWRPVRYVLYLIIMSFIVMVLDWVLFASK